MIQNKNKNKHKHLLFLTEKPLALSVSLILLCLLSACGTTEEVDAAGNFITLWDSVAFNIGSRSVYFYALCIIAGILSGYEVGKYFAKRLNFSEDDLFWLLIIGIVVGVLGAKIYYYVFYDFASLKANPLIIFTDFIEGNGGLAIHGGLIAIVILVIIYCKVKHLNALVLAEVICPSLFIGQILGRWGNFFNHEAHGGAIVAGDVAASRAFLEKLHLPKFIIDNMYIYENGSFNYMHPTFLYEGCWNALGLIIVLIWRFCDKKHWKIGDSLAFYLIWYGIGRFGIEALRTDYLPVTLFGHEFRQAQVISVIMILIAIVYLVLTRTVFKTKMVSFREEFDKNNQRIKEEKRAKKEAE